MSLLVSAAGPTARHAEGKANHRQAVDYHDGLQYRGRVPNRFMIDIDLNIKMRPEHENGDDQCTSDQLSVTKQEGAYLLKVEGRHTTKDKVKRIRQYKTILILIDGVPDA